MRDQPTFNALRTALFLLILFALTTTGPAWSADTIRWVFTDYPPANYRTPEGAYSGFFHDIVMDIFEKRLGLAVKIDVLPWKRCQMMVADGNADLMVTIPTPQRLTYAVTHDNPVWVKRRIIYTYRNHPRRSEFDRLLNVAQIKSAGVSVVSYLGNGWIETTVQGAGIPVLFATTVEGMYQMLAARRGDILIEEKNLAGPLIRRLNLDDSIVRTAGLASESGFHILIGKRSPYASMVSRVNVEIEAMRRRGGIDHILERYGVGPD